jgi:hypothetical protein
LENRYKTSLGLNPYRDNTCNAYIALVNNQNWQARRIDRLYNPKKIINDALLQRDISLNQS